MHLVIYSYFISIFLCPKDEISIWYVTCCYLTYTTSKNETKGVGDDQNALYIPTLDILLMNEWLVGRETSQTKVLKQLTMYNSLE